MATIPHSNVKVYIFHDPAARQQQVLKLHDVGRMDLTSYIPVAGIYIPPADAAQGGHALDQALKLTQGDWAKTHLPVTEVYKADARPTRRGDVMVENNLVWINAGPYFSVMDGQNASALLLKIPDPAIAIEAAIQALNVKYSARTALHSKGIMVPNMEAMWQIECHHQKPDGQVSQLPVQYWNEDPKATAEQLRTAAREPIGKMTRLEAWVQAVANNHQHNIAVYRLKPLPVFDPFDL